MKLYISIILVGLISLVLADPACRVDSDCNEDECCIEQFLFRKAECQKLLQKGDACSKTGFLKLRFRCPCVSGLECEPESVEKKDGITIMKNFRCVEPSGTTEGVTETPSPEK